MARILFGNAWRPAFRPGASDLVAGAQATDPPAKEFNHPVIKKTEDGSAAIPIRFLGFS
jgi:hypothetical protein